MTAHEIGKAIAKAIHEHKVLPGTKLGEDELSEIYGVSRTLVRSALQGLSHELLVDIQPNRGAFVAKPSLREAREIFEARALLEPRTARSAALRMTQDAARRLQKINANLNMILGIELACAVQGVGFRAPLKTSPMLQDVIARVRTKITPLDQDRFMAPDLELAAMMIADGSLVKGLEMPAHILGQSTG